MYVCVCRGGGRGSSGKLSMLSPGKQGSTTETPQSFSCEEKKSSALFYAGTTRKHVQMYPKSDITEALQVAFQVICTFQGLIWNTSAASSRSDLTTG